MTQSLHILSIPRPSTVFSDLRARLRPGDVDLDVVEGVLGQFGLKLVEPIRNLPVGRRNKNVAVETDAGKKLLKGYRPQWEAETVRYGHSILTALAEAGFPAPRLTVALHGETYASWHGAHYALFDFEAGANYSGKFLWRAHRRRLMQIAGGTLARLHRALDGFMPEGRHHMGFIDYTRDRRRDLGWHEAKVDELKEKSARVADAEERAAALWMVEQSPYILDELGRLSAILNAAELPRLVIHGDYGLHNLLLRRDGSAVPVDFELARLEWRLSDLVSCLSRFRYGRSAKLAYDFESIGWFMAGYESVFPVSEGEWRLLPQVWAFYRLQSAVQYWNSYFETGGPARKLHSARDALDQVAWALNDPADLLTLNISM